MLDESARGVFVIAVTPFDDRGCLDLAGTDRLIDFYRAAGVDGITILGIMGEAPKLAHEEATAFARRVIARAAGLPVVVGVSAPGFAPMAALARAVMDLGAAGVMIAPPGGLKGDDGIVGYFQDCAEAIGADVPFVLQDFPQANGLYIPVGVIERVIRTCPSCVMLKHEDWPGLAKISALRASSDRGDTRRISILCGNGGLFLPEEMTRGADGAMTGFCFPEMMVGVVREHGLGNLERAHDIFDAYLPLARYEQQQGIGLASRKYVLAKRGVIASPRLRSPAPTLTPADVADLERLLDRQARRLSEIGA
jgi:4-hydroxy-tetrahydrodipicolinate synthase